MVCSVRGAAELGAARELVLALRAVTVAADHLRLTTATGLLGLSRSEVGALFRLSIDGPVSPSELAVELRLTTQALTALVDRLVDDQLVVRSPHPRDRRKILVELTEIGDRAMQRYSDQIESVLAGSVAELSAAERAIVTGFLWETARGLSELPALSLEELTVEHDRQGALLVRLIAELDMASVDPVRTRLREVVLAEAGENQVIIDVSELTYLPSVGIRLLEESVGLAPGRVRIQTTAGSHSARVLDLVGVAYETTGGR